jgi:acetyl esterase/lipase
VTKISYDMASVQKVTDGESSNKNQENDAVVTGFLLQHHAEPSEKVIFWLYGGAFLSGDSEGNLGVGKYKILFLSHSQRSFGPQTNRRKHVS